MDDMQTAPLKESEGRKKKESIAAALKRLKWHEHLASGWPVVLAVYGGLVGTICAAAAYFLNVKIFNSNLRESSKYLFAALVGVGAFIVFFIAANVLFILFPGLKR